MTDLERMEVLLFKGCIGWNLQAELEPMTVRPSGKVIMWLSDKEGEYAWYTFDSDGGMIDGGRVDPR